MANGGIVFGVSSDVIFYLIGGGIIIGGLGYLMDKGEGKPNDYYNYRAKRTFETYAVSYAVGRLEDRMLNIIHAVAANRQQVRDAIDRIKAELAKYRQQLVDAVVKFRQARDKFKAGTLTREQMLDELAVLRNTVRAIVKNIVETLQIAVRINLNPVSLPSRGDLRGLIQQKLDDAVLARHRNTSLPGGTLPPQPQTSPLDFNPALPAYP